MDKIKQWTESAELDYNIANHLFETYYPTPVEIICYHCQQSAEKAIKSLFIKFKTNIGIPKTHDLSFILNQIKNNVNIDEKIYDYADTLTPYGVSTRYPHELFLTKKEAEIALKYTKEIINWVKGEL